MKNETVILLAPSKDYSNHKLCKYAPYWGFGHPFWFYDYEPLKKIFSRVIVYDYIERLLEKGFKGINEDLIELAKKEKPKYIVWPSVNYEFLETTFDKIRKLGTKIIGLFFDDEFRFDNYSKYWIPHLDFCVTNCKEVLEKYSRFGAKVIHVFVCHNLPLDVDWENIKYKYEVSFVGTKTPERVRYIKEIKKRGIKVYLAGYGWNLRGKIPFEEMLEIFQTSKINLNFSGTKGGKKGWKGRILEVINAGGFLLTEYRPGIEEFFEIDKEIVCFKNANEMVEKIIYYLNHEEERKRIAQAGWKKGITTYTPLHMYSKIFEAIENSSSIEKGNNEFPLETINMPKEIRRIPSYYYLNWGKVFLIANHKEFWKDAFSISLSYDPSNFQTKFFQFIGSLPFFIRFIILLPYVLSLKSLNFFKKILVLFPLPLFVWKVYYKLRAITRGENL
jgi:spore maturation protein CgeB